MFESVTHYFPVRGHSFLPCDRDFGSIKRVVRKVDRVYNPDQYADLIVKASKTNRLAVHHVTSDTILSFKTWWPQHYKNVFSQMRPLEEVFQKTKECQEQLNDIPQFPTVKAYLSGKVPINKKKIDDLKKLSPCTVGYESVYSKIFQWPTTEAECNVDREFEDLPFCGLPQKPSAMWTESLKTCLSGKVPINKKKIDDLKKLSPCTVGYESVYSKIFQWPTTEAECNVDREFEDEYA
ncbi:hypothetical protein J6590_009893 [Homalodisca vitripennis]|nr:hypothetical protein J6590_009893 [Homalodisca vitripennis]